MSRAEKIALIKTLIANYKAIIAAEEERDTFSAGTYSWSEMLEDNTGIYLDDESNIDSLSDEALTQIINAYI